MQIYNTLTQSKQLFTPINENEVKMYVCGPTVYDKGHLGHGRSMIAFDVIRRYLQYKGYTVKFVTNYTDIDDKMIERADREGVTVAKLADLIKEFYERDFGRLNILKPDARPLATEYIEEMLTMIKTLIKKGHAYELADGIYFDVKTFPGYGKLSKQDLDDLQAGARIEVDKTKRNPQDFVLWKVKKEGEPSWVDSEGIIPEGRPGWHIECSAMTWSLLGETFDIHAGGADLMFPHHECEIAQSEACFGETMANFWLHNGYVKIDGEKMSKSLNNFLTLEGIFEEYDPLVVRYALMSNHYRGPIDFSVDFLVQAGNSLQRIRDFVSRLERYAQSGLVLSLDQVVSRDFAKELEEQFVLAMDDDFEVSRALAAIFTMITDVNVHLDKQELTPEQAASLLVVLQRIDTIMACIFVEDDEIPAEIMDLLRMRDMARQAKDYRLADSLRDQINEAGYLLEDIKGETVVKRKLV